MPLPILKRCCGCLSLEAGCIIVNLVSAVICIANISFGSWQLPCHKERRNEDNLILMSIVMFATLSLISNIVVLLGMLRRRPSYLQLSIMSNAVFILCLFLVAVVACLFSPGLRPFLHSAGNIVLVVILMIGGAVYSLYYLTVVNSMYTKMKLSYADSEIPRLSVAVPV